MLHLRVKLFAGIYTEGDAAHAANIIRASMGNISCKGNEEGGTDGCDLIRVAEKVAEPRAGQPERVDENKRGFGCADRKDR